MAQDLETVIESITNKADHADFIYDLLLAYGISKNTITKAKKEAADLFAGQNQIILKKKVLFERVPDGVNVLGRLDELQKDDASYAKDPRFIIVTDFKDIAAYDTKTKEAPLAIPFKELYRHSEFFLPWSGREKYEAHLENPADVKAAERMAKIYDEIYTHNREFATTNNHALNVFLVRLLFCFFAEDTGIFEGENIFTEALTNHTQEDGSDLNQFFEMLYESLDKRDKAGYPSYIRQFPYVNGHLFSERFEIPTLTAKVRHLILECGGQNWKEINPDIFGSMFQAVKDSRDRSVLGQHYTSVPNIMKVINPLFMDGLCEDFKKAYNDPKQLKKLQARLSNIRIFDPACGSGNFLIIALKQLKLFEMDIVRRIAELDKHLNMKMNLSVIQLKQFFGIEIDDFACEIARLSLWLAEHQMNCKFKEEFGITRPTLPLTQSGHIVCGNACRLNWEEVCPKYLERSPLEEFVASDLNNTPMKLSLPKEEAEIYVLGNPPYAGARKQKKDQKEDLDIVFQGYDRYRDLDYVACWFLLGAKYITSDKIRLAFVTTNSICQGQQVALLWNKLLCKNIEIHFAYEAFKWSNNAKNNAGVTCVIVGLATKNTENKIIYNGTGVKQIVSNISPYIGTKSAPAVSQVKHSISLLPKMRFGNMPNDGGNLILSKEEKDHLISTFPEAAKYIRSLFGSAEYIRGLSRYCLWIGDIDKDSALDIPFIAERVNKTRVHRLESKDAGTRKLANRPHQFRDLNESDRFSIIIPRVSSERRKYIPIGFLGAESIISDSAQAIYDADVWLFGVLTSYMHMLWVKNIGGYLGTSIRYSAELCYNTFPFPKITDTQKKKIELYANQILEVREKYFNKTLAELYDPDKMPKDLAEAHHNLDLCIESCYRKRPFENDDQRLKHLFKMYELMSSGAKDEDLKQLELL